MPVVNRFIWWQKYDLFLISEIYYFLFWFFGIVDNFLAGGWLLAAGFLLIWICLMIISHCLLATGFSLPASGNRPLDTCLLHITYCLLHIHHCSLFILHRALFIVHCQLSFQHHFRPCKPWYSKEEYRNCFHPESQVVFIIKAVVNNFKSFGHDNE